MFLRALASPRTSSICSLLELPLVVEAIRSAAAEGFEIFSLRETILDPGAAEFDLESEVSTVCGESADPRPTRKAAPQLMAQAAAKIPFFEVIGW
jgi:hypothetical protein